MKLNDLIEALAAEVELARPHMEGQLDELARLAPDEQQFYDVMVDYSDQTHRMGEASEMAGFPGLQAVCAHVLENSLALPAGDESQRKAVIEFLRGWPPLIAWYLRNLSDPSAAAGVVDYLVHAPYPMAEEEALKVMHMLGGMPLQMQLPGDSDSLRPVLASEADVALAAPDGTDPKLLEGFVQEAPEQARFLVSLVTKFAAGERDASEIAAAKRSAHTLKGSGAIIGLRGIAALSHHFEDILEYFEHSSGGVSPVVANALLDAAYCLEQMVGYVCGVEEYPAQALGVLQSVLDIANRIDRGEDLLQAGERVAPMARHTPATEESTAAGAPSAAVAPAAALRVGMDRIEELFRVAGEISVHGAAMEVRIKSLTDRARELMDQNLRVQKRLFELETAVDVRALTMMRARTTRSVDAAFDPLEMDQYSELHSTSHALMEEAADARALSQRLQEDLGQLGGVHTSQQRLSKDLQHLVIGTRMAPASTLESRLQRAVRSTCQATGKEATLEVRGGETQIDSDVLAQLAEPLLHILRNAVDHGLESPVVREEAGKARSGRIELSFARQGQQVVLRCRDDGQGLDLARVRRKAIERRLIDEAQELDEEQTARLILLPGFSTRDSVSEISGRGVGLDVVREWASTMKGTVRIQTVLGEGCTIELRFAASLTTQHSLIVEVDGWRVALPSVQVEQAIARGLGEFADQGGELVFREGKRTLPAARLAELTGMTRRGAARPFADCDAVIVNVDDAPRALAVDRLIDSRELLVKAPGLYARHMKGVAGLSILGDGSVAVNLDVSSLFVAGTVTRAEDADDVASAAPEARALRKVLVVDDSLSVRNSLVQLVRDEGFDAQSARDGMEAIEKLGSFRPDIVLTDLEMPNMNGIELTTHIRGRSDMGTMPVIMITSRSQEKHKRMVEQCGVTAYVTKPYNDTDLLRTIREALAAQTA